MGIFEKFKLGFKKSASTFASGLKEIIIKKAQRAVERMVAIGRNH